MKNWKVALAVTVIMAIANLPLQYPAYRVLYVEPFVVSQPEATKSIVDYEPFFHTWYGVLAIIVWIVLIVLWFGCLGFKGKVLSNNNTVLRKS